MDNFDANALDGTFQTAISSGALSGTSASGPISVTGLPITSAAVITIKNYTPTPTETPTATPTPNPSATPTPTPLPPTVAVVVGP